MWCAVASVTRRDLTEIRRRSEESSTVSAFDEKENARIRPSDRYSDFYFGSHGMLLLSVLVKCRPRAVRRRCIPWTTWFLANSELFICDSCQIDLECVGHYSTPHSNG